MAGIGEFYYVGSSGGFLGSDGLCGTDLVITVWYGNRMYLEHTHKTYNLRPITLSLKRFIPIGPDDPDMLRIAMILYASNLFEECPSFNKVKEELEGVERIDFNMNEDVPEHFKDLLEESRKIDISNKVDIYQAEPLPVTI